MIEIKQSTFPIKCDLSATTLLDAFIIYKDKHDGVPHTLVISPSDYFPAQEIMIEEEPFMRVLVLKGLPMDHWFVIGHEGCIWGSWM